jgi:predicted 2-oxoglutarate/Fe(II)-dependent dioxygenase YbiX/peroxiredoxin
MAQILVPGEPAPRFTAPALEGNPSFVFDSAAARWIVLLLLGTAATEPASAALRLVRENRDLFDDREAAFFGVTMDPGDAEQGRIAKELPGIRWFLDYAGAVSTRFGAVSVEGGRVSHLPHWLLLDPMLRVHRRAALADGAEILGELRALKGQPPVVTTAPLLVVPEVLPPQICQQLIELYERHGGTQTGAMKEVDGVTVHQIDLSHKRRADYTLQDQELIAGLKDRLARVLRPMIQRAFQFDPTRIERFIVARYDGAEGGHFRPHRDNTTKGTAHRKFACTINLNAKDYEGGDLRFPEFGPRIYRAPTGGAVVFSCSLLHEARPVTRGRRYAFLPFLYDDAGARLREQNLAFVAPELRDYRSGLASEEANEGGGGSQTVAP